MSENLNPFSYGVLTAKVESLEKKVDRLETSIEQLLELANKGKGGFWMGMTIAAAIGSLGTFLSTWVFHKV